MSDPEELARQEIDALLAPCGWTVQDKSAVNLSASRGVAVRELSFTTGEPDYTLFVDGKSIGTIEAKPAGHSLTGVEEQSENTSEACLSVFLYGVRCCRSATNPPKLKRAS